MSARRGSAVTGVLAVLLATAGCDATPQQPSGTLSNTGDQVFSLIASAVRQELRPVVGRLESRIEDLDGRLTLLDSRVSERITQVSSGEPSQQMDELSSRLDSLETRLNEMIAQINDHKSKQDEEDRAVNQTSTQQAAVDQLDDTASLPRDCSDLPVGSPSGIYSVLPSSDYQPVQAFCDMDSAGGNWTVIHWRDDVWPRQDFYQGWAEYRQGFGNLSSEFWWGLENIHQLTASNETQYELRVDLEGYGGAKAHAVYHEFGVSSEDDGYRLRAYYFRGRAGDGLQRNINRTFTTHDRGFDQTYDNCPDDQRYQGGWWFAGCRYTNLNGQYGDSNTWFRDGIWYTWVGLASNKKTEMRIRPRQM